MKNCPMIKRPRHGQHLISEAELQSKGRENEFNEIKGENFPSQRGRHIKTQESFRSPIKHD